MRLARPVLESGGSPPGGGTGEGSRPASARSSPPSARPRARWAGVLYWSDHGEPEVARTAGYDDHMRLGPKTGRGEDVVAGL